MNEKLLGKFLDDAYDYVIRVPGRSIARRAASLDMFRKGRRRYFESLEAMHGQVRILGMPRPIPLSTLYVRVRLLGSPTVKKYLDGRYVDYLNEREQVSAAIQRELDRTFVEDATDGVSAIANARRVILHGGPGSGKSTFLRYVALSHSGHIKERPPSMAVLFPVLITLRDLNAGKTTFEKLIHEQLAYSRIPNPDAFLERLLDQGAAILLLDGLDEVLPNKQKTFIAQLKRFVAKYPRAYYVLASRSIEALNELETFTEMQIAEFGDAEISRFVSKWFEGPDSAKGTELLGMVDDDIRLRELASTPLLLSLLCILYRADLQIPKNRAELYSRCIECLLRQWDAQRGFRRTTDFERLSDERKLQLFASVAAHFFDNGELIFSENALTFQVAKFLSALDIDLDSARKALGEIESHHGILTQRSRGHFAFAHLTFQEYFVARHAVANHEFNKLASHVNDARWKEVICLAAGAMHDCGHFINALLAHVNKKRLDLLAKQGVLGHAYVVLRSLVESELSINKEARRSLYGTFLRQHLRMFPVPWEYIAVKYRFSPRARRMLVRLGVRLPARASVTRLDALRAFRHMLEIASTAPPFLRYCKTVAKLRGSQAQASFDAFVNLCREIAERGVGFKIRIEV